LRQSHAILRAAKRIKGVDPEQLVRSVRSAYRARREDRLTRVTETRIANRALYRGRAHNGQVFGAIIDESNGCVVTILPGNHWVHTPKGPVRVDGSK
jgi:hypothetical protein